MPALFQLNRSNSPKPSAGTRILKANEYADLIEASRIIEAAQKRAEEIRSEAEEEYKRRFEAGYVEGIEAGRMEHAEKVMETVLASVEFIEKIENTVVTVVTESVRKIIGEMSDEERIRRIVSTALTHVRGEQKVIVRVSPQDEAYVTKALSAMTSGTYLTVVADPRLKKDSCILESNLGVIDASLDTQMKALEHAFASKIHGQQS